MVTKGQVSGVEEWESVLCRRLMEGKVVAQPLLGEGLLRDMFNRKPTFCDECRFLFPVPSQLLNMERADLLRRQG